MSRRTSMANAERKRPRWLLPAIVIPAVLFLAGGLLFSNQRTLEACAVCNSIHVVDASGFGSDPFRPWWVATRTEETRPSITCTDFFDGHCAHRWSHFSSQGGVMFFRVFTGTSLPPQPLAWKYESSDLFHAHVKRMLKLGTLTKEDFRAACGIPAVPTPSDLADPEKRRLMDLGLALLRGAEEEGAAAGWTEALRAAAVGSPAPR